MAVVKWRRGLLLWPLAGPRAHPSLHPLDHEALILGDDHAVLLGHEEQVGWSFHSSRPTAAAMQAREIGR
jgi:hypothetical protein